jgi:hypothetical protein
LKKLAEEESISQKGREKRREQNFTALQQAENGDKVADIWRNLAISQATLYTWKKERRDENSRQNRLIADLFARSVAALTGSVYVAHTGTSQAPGDNTGLA